MIETTRLLLRPYLPSDIDALQAIVSDAVTMQFWPAPFDLTATRRWVQRSFDSYQVHGYGRWAALVKDAGQLVGDCGYLRIDVDGAPEIDLGYIFHQSAWGRGLATEAASACLEFGLRTLGFQRVVANMETRHLASRRVAEKIGLRLEREFLNARNRDLPTCLYATAKTPTISDP